MRRFATKIIDWVIFVAATIVILLAVLLSLARIFLPYMTQYQARIADWASQALHRPVHIGQMQAAWRGFEPEFKFQNVEILNQQGTQVLLKVNELDVGINLLKSLIKWNVEPGLIIISGANLAVHQDSTGKITFNGIAAPAMATDQNLISTDDILQWLFTQQRIYLENVDVTWYGKDGLVLPLRNIRVKLVNGVLSHQLSGAAVLQEPSPTTFRFVLNIDGDMLMSKDFKAKFYLHAKNISLSDWLKNRSFYGLNIVNGKINHLRLWANWDHQQLQSVQSVLDARQVELKSQKITHALILNHLAANMLWQRESNGWALAGKDMQVILNGDKWAVTQLSLHVVNPQDSQAATQTLQISSLNSNDLKNILFATHFLSPAISKTWENLQPSGILSNLAITHTGTDFKNNQFSVVTGFQDISWQRWGKLPGVTNLSGTLKFTPSNGTLMLQSSQTQFDFGNLFRETIPIDRLTGKLIWQKIDSSWQIEASDVETQNPVVSVHGNMGLLIPKDSSSPIINILAGFNLSDPTQAMPYLPVGIMSKNLVKWLDEAIISGKSSSGNVVLTGPIRDFPFVHNEGRFIVDSQLQDVALHYRDGWPDIQHINGQLEFVNNSMAVNASSGQIFNATLSNVQASIPNLPKATLTVTGNVTGDLNDGWKFLQESPLYNSIGKQISAFELKGPMTLGLRLVIPLATSAPAQVKGNLAFQKSALKIPDWWHIVVNQLQGNLQFTENSLSGNMQGQWFDQPLNVKISTITSGKTNITQFDLGDNQNTLQQLQQRFDLPQSNYISGALKYHALLQFRTGVNPQNALIVNSDLQGITVNLPKPLNKLPQDKIPSQLQVFFSDVQPLRVLINYGKHFSAALTYKKINQQYALHSGELHFGPGQPTFQTQAGLLISGYLANFIWGDWKDLLVPNLKSTPALKPTAPPLRKVDITFGKLNLFGMTFIQTELSIVPQPQAWQVGIHNPTIIGQLIIPKIFPRGNISGYFQRLYLPAANKKNNNITTLTPAKVPSFSLVSDDFHYGDKALGHVELDTTAVANQLNINELLIKSPQINLTARGRWQGNQTSQQTFLAGQLNSTDLGTVLKNWNATKNLVGGNGKANFSLNWSGAPYQAALKNLSGKVNLKFYNGRIINLSQSAETELGIGRVLNLLSLQTIPRRLRLDFSDLTDEGFSFDIMQGDFTLQQGNAFTRNAYIDGPVAKIVMKGRIGLGQQDYDLYLGVTPYVTSSVPIVATIAGGPIVGAATWVASKIFSPVVEEISTYSYHVTGTWDNPVTVKTKANNAR